MRARTQPKQTEKPSARTRPRVVTIGGGTGHFAVLSGLKKHDVDLTAVVTMADDGGSTGLLRDELGVLPPGDLRQCLVALSEGDEVMRKLFAHRFSGGSLKGHTFGNIFLSTLEHVTGSIDHAVEEVGRILKIKGRVLPVTLSHAKLVLHLANGKRLAGEHVIDEYQLISRFGVKSAELAPAPTLNPAVRTAISGADLIVLGPGDLYTSLLPNLLVPGMARALKKSPAKKVFVANLMNKYGHTDGFDCMQYVEEYERLAGMRFTTHILFNEDPIPTRLLKRYLDEGEPVACESPSRISGLACVGAELFSPVLLKAKKGDALRRTYIRHDADKLAAALMRLI